MQLEMKKCCFLLISLFLILPAFGQEIALDTLINKETYVYAKKEGKELKLDKYRLKKSEEQQACVVFVFGGHFAHGNRDNSVYTHYFNFLAKNGYTVVSIDYRLGLEGNVKSAGIANYKPFKNAIALAVADLYTATNYVVSHAGEWNINPKQVIVSGSSAGGITVLQALFESQNGYDSAKILPKNFRYAGAISFAGGILSTEGSLEWEKEPCPVLLFHGEDDETVDYDGIRFFWLNFATSKKIAKSLDETKTSYQFFSFKGEGHDVAEDKMNEEEIILNFLQQLVKEKQKIQMTSFINKF